MARKTARKTKKGARPVARTKKAAHGAPRATRTAMKRAPARTTRAAARSRKVSPVPAGMHTVTPSLALSDCAKALDFYQEAFGAKELMRMTTPDGKKIMHAEIRIGDSVVYLNDFMGGAAPPSKESPSSSAVWLYVPDADAVFDRAVKAGATVGMPMADAFWGDRMGMILDPFGVPWGIATRVKNLTQEEMRKAGEEFFRMMGERGGPGGEPPQAPGAGEAPSHAHGA